MLNKCWYLLSLISENILVKYGIPVLKKKEYVIDKKNNLKKRKCNTSNFL